MKPDFQALFTGQTLSPELEKRFRDKLTELGFTASDLTIVREDGGPTSYEILLPHKVYTMSSLLNINKIIAACISHLQVEIKFQARKVGTLICFEFF